MTSRRESVRLMHRKRPSFGLWQLFSKNESCNDFFSFFCSEQYLTVLFFLLFPLQYPTLVRMCAVTSVSSGLADTPAPARRGPLRWRLTPMSVTQVKNKKKPPVHLLPALIHKSILHTCLAAPVWFCETVVWYCCCWFCVCLAFAPSAIEPPVAMPLACRCMNGGTCYTDEGGLPKCKWV